MNPLIVSRRLLGAVSLMVAVLILAGCAAREPIDQRVVEQEINVFLEQALPEIFDPFDYSKMLNHTSSEVATANFALVGLFKNIGAASGSLKEYEVRSKEIGYDLELDYDVDAEMYAIYVLDSKFDYTTGTIKLQMAKQDDVWQIVFWDVRSAGL